MGYIRILLIPVFIYIYVTAQSVEDYYRAAAVVLISTFSDLFDGLIARKFNMVTELGKLIDPLADKLSHFAMIICLFTRYKLIWLFLAVFIVKECFMAVMGFIIVRHNGRRLDGAMWFGKVCTAVLFLAMFALFLLPTLDIKIVEALIFVCVGVMLVTLVLYIPVFAKMYKEP